VSEFHHLRLRVSETRSLVFSQPSWVAIFLASSICCSSLICSLDSVVDTLASSPSDPTSITACFFWLFAIFMSSFWLSLTCAACGKEGCGGGGGIEGVSDAAYLLHHSPALLGNPLALHLLLLLVVQDGQVLPQNVDDLVHGGALARLDVQAAAENMLDDVAEPGGHLLDGRALHLVHGLVALLEALLREQLEQQAPDPPDVHLVGHDLVLRGRGRQGLVDLGRDVVVPRN
jgi:hypothetical protein